MPTSLKKRSRTPGRNPQPARKASAGTSTVASTRASSSKKGRHKYSDDEEFIPSAAEEERGDASKALKYMKSLSLHDE